MEVGGITESYVYRFRRDHKSPEYNFSPVSQIRKLRSREVKCPKLQS